MEKWMKERDPRMCEGEKGETFIVKD